MLGKEVESVQNNWGMQDPDWQLRRLQQDCVRTSDKALAVLFSSIQQEVMLVHHEYEKIFGPNSAQFAEYITLVLQKLNSQGICSKTCGDWLVAASSGVIPPVHASASFNTQSQTLKQIPGEFRNQLESTLEYSRLPDDAEFESSALTSGDGQTWPPQSDSAHETFLPHPAGADLIQETSAFNNPWGEVASEAPAKTSKTGLNSLMPASLEGASPFSQPDFAHNDSSMQPQMHPGSQSVVQPVTQSPIQPVATPVPQAVVSNQVPINPWDSFDNNPVVPAPQAVQPVAMAQQISQNNPLAQPVPAPESYGQAMQTSASSWPSPQTPAQAFAQQPTPFAAAQNVSGGQPVFQQQISQPQPPVAPSPWGVAAPQAASQPFSQAQNNPIAQPSPAAYGQPSSMQPAAYGQHAAPPQPVFEPQVSQQISQPQPAYQQQSAYAQQISQTNQIPQQQSAYAQQISQTNQIPQQQSAYAQQISQANQIPQQQSAYAQQISQTNQIPPQGLTPQNQYNQQYNSANAQEPPQAAQPVYANVPNASMSGGWWDNPAEENNQWENQRQDSGSDEKDPNYTYDPATAWD